MFDAFGLLERVREKKPLVHQITNMVTISDCAAATRAFGALPVMAHSREDAEQMVASAGALVLNIGTLDPELVETMVLVGKAANRRRVPVVFDAVGAGATKLRTESSFRILEEVKVDVLKGNYGELGVLAGAKAQVRGVESVSVEGDPVLIAGKLSSDYGNTVAMTGKRDIVTGGGRTCLIDNGHPLMGAVVGTGCMAAAVIGAFAAVERNYTLASAAALTCFDIAGEIAARGSMGPGSFKGHFIDAAHGLKKEHVETLTKAEWK
jgi:hydroxyethylthiazole kinase